MIVLERTHEAWRQVSLRIKAQLLISLQHMIVVAGGTHPQRMVWRVTKAPKRVEQRPLAVPARCSAGSDV